VNSLLNRSLNEKKPIEIIYQSKDNAFTKRVILVKMMNEKYIKAYCYTKKELRIFKIDSILAASSVKENRKERYYA
jgi:predicted DNA-binding transcriptional regulator YafY